MLRIVAILCPPLAVVIAGHPSQAATNVVLSLLLYVPGLWHALTIVDRYLTDRRNAALMRAVAKYEG